MSSRYRVAKTHRIPYLYRSFSAKRDLYLVTLLWKMICNLGDPMSLRHPVWVFHQSANFSFLGGYVKDLARERMSERGCLGVRGNVLLQCVVTF